MKTLGVFVFFLGLLPACIVSGFVTWILPGGLVLLLVGCLCQLVKLVAPSAGNFLMHATFWLFGAIALIGGVFLDVYVIHRWFGTNLTLLVTFGALSAAFIAFLPRHFR